MVTVRQQIESAIADLASQVRTLTKRLDALEKGNPDSWLDDTVEPSTKHMRSPNAKKPKMVASQKAMIRKLYPVLRGADPDLTTHRTAAMLKQMLRLPQTTTSVASWLRNNLNAPRDGRKAPPQRRS